MDRGLSWDDALTEIAVRLAAIRAEHGAAAVAFAVTTLSGTPMVDSIEWVERFVRWESEPRLRDVARPDCAGGEVIER